MKALAIIAILAAASAAAEDLTPEEAQAGMVRYFATCSATAMLAAERSQDEAEMVHVASWYSTPVSKRDVLEARAVVLRQLIDEHLAWPDVVEFAHACDAEREVNRRAWDIAFEVRP